MSMGVGHDWNNLTILEERQFLAGGRPLQFYGPG